MLRDVFIEGIYEKMAVNKNIYFLSADFGAPMLDRLRVDFPGRFINVGIAEQNLINIATGLALEGQTVYAYGIAPFLIMRAYEQIRINLAVLSSLRELNVNLIGVGIGLSYDVSGPTHHCLEDVGIIRILPSMQILSPCDGITAQAMVDYTFAIKRPKYIRLDGKPLAQVYSESGKLDFKDGYSEIAGGEVVCLVTTGYMTQKALRIRERLLKEGVKVGVIDLFLIKPINESGLAKKLADYAAVLTLEEGFVGKGGIDSLVRGLIGEQRFRGLGFKDEYVFEIGNREYLHGLNGLADEDIIKAVKGLLKQADER